MQIVNTPRESSSREEHFNHHGTFLRSAAVLDGERRYGEPDLARSSSTHTVSLMSLRDRSTSNVSEASTVNGSGAPAKPDAPHIPFISHPLLANLQERQHRLDIGVEFGRHGKPEARDRIGPYGRMIGDTFDFAGHLGPELAATLHQRLAKGDSPKRKRNESFTETDWSFDIPLAQALKSVLIQRILPTRISGGYHIAESARLTKALDRY